MPPRYHVLTGAPGTGKTTTLTALEGSWPVVAEPARELTAELRNAGRAVTRDGVEAMETTTFVERILERSITKYPAHVRASGSVIFDRGIPDRIAYANHLGVDSSPSLQAAARYRYNGKVLLAEPWAEMYTTDDERTMAFEPTVEFHGHLVAAYRAAGYTPVIVPRGSVEQRARFLAGEWAHG